MIRFTQVTKQYPQSGTIALQDVSFSVQPGEFVFVVGASAAGKSTLIKLMLREEEATGGEIVINGFDLVRMKKKQVPYLRRSIGVVFQDFRLLGDRTVYETVAFAMEVIGTSRSRIRHVVPRILRLVGLEARADAKPGQLSGGEQQRVSLARALANHPPVIVADEPTGNLDPKTSREIMYLLEDINRRGTTVLVATHARELVNEMQKRVLELDSGRLVRDESAGRYGNV